MAGGGGRGRRRAMSAVMPVDSRLVVAACGMLALGSGTLDQLNLRLQRRPKTHPQISVQTPSENPGGKGGYHTNNMITPRHQLQFTPTLLVRTRLVGAVHQCFRLLLFSPSTRISMDAVLIILAANTSMHRNFAFQTEAEGAGFASEDSLILIIVVEKDSGFAGRGRAGEVGGVLFEVGGCSFRSESA